MILISYLLSWGASDASAFCSPGTKTAFATSCANAWSDPVPGTTAPFYPWGTETPAGVVDPVRLNGDNCRSITVKGRHPTDHRVRIQCDGSANELWVNRDTLRCEPTNLRERPSLEVTGELKACEGFGTFGVQSGAKLTPFEGMSYDIGDVTSAPARAIVTKAFTKFKQTRERIQGDQSKLVAFYEADYKKGDRAQARRSLYERMSRAEKNLEDLKTRTASVFGLGIKGEPCEGSVKGPYGFNLQAKGQMAVLRARKLCRLYTMAYDLVHNELKEERDKAEGSYAKLPKGNNVLQQDFVAERVGTAIEDLVQSGALTKPGAAEYIKVAYRQIIFEGLKPEEQKLVLPPESGGAPLSAGGKRLSMVTRTSELAELGAKNGVFLHNGYVYGGNRYMQDKDSATDCSSFISDIILGDNALPGQTPTTFDFDLIHQQLAGEGLSPDERTRVAPFTSLSRCFEAVDYRTTPPSAADIVVSRSGGHMVVVHSYDPKTGMVQTAEAAGGYHDTVSVQLTRPIYEPSCLGASRPADGDWTERPVRSDLRVLRLKRDLQGTGCPLRVDS